MKGTTKKYFIKDGRESRKTERWCYVFGTGVGADGKRHQQWKRGFLSKAEADKALGTAIAAHRKGNAPASKETQHFKDAFLEWSREYGNANWEETTRETNEKRGAYAIALFGKFKLGALTTKQIDLGLNHLKLHGGRKTEAYPMGKSLSKKTCHAVYSLLRQFLSQMLIWGDIERNPMLGVRAPSLADQPEAESLTFDEYDRLLARVRDTRYFAMAVYGADSGSRCGEMLALTWADIDQQTRDVHISKSLAQTKTRLYVKKTKSNKSRIVTISPVTLEILLEHRAVTQSDKELYGQDYCERDLVFPNPQGDYLRPKQVSGRVSEFMKKAGIKKSLHKLRHFCATVRLANGESLPAVSAHLGHTDGHTTLKIYAHALPGDRARGVKIWQAAVGDIVARSRSEEPQPEPPTIVSTAKKQSESEDGQRLFVSTGVSTRGLHVVNG